MKLAIINCRSIVNKYAELEALLNVQNLDLLIGTESHLDEAVMCLQKFFHHNISLTAMIEIGTVVVSSSKLEATFHLP